MKKLLGGVALAALVASPVLAKPRHVHAAPRGAHAVVPNDSIDVVKGGRVIGRDPDPAIRMLILRDSVKSS